ncbi:MAG: hypothetical protein A2X48_17795 [Lentisphaerae bacterium GWF2_49_21]|nr:MAG: hypothetical protein A2X48_17795 [Lentisphaerae bacterium GWF2_49_21]
MKEIFSTNTTDKLIDLLESASRLSALHVCFHDRMNIIKLPQNLRTHAHPSCQKIKRTYDGTCLQFDWFQTHGDLANMPQGRIHECPFGFTEIAVPVFVNGMFEGVVFAGPCLRKIGNIPNEPELKVVPDPQWLNDRLSMMQAFSEKISSLLEGRWETESGGRRAAILSFINKNSGRIFQIEDLAGHLCLSASRTGHLVKEIFGIPFPKLVQSYKMRKAARMLISDDLPIGEIARRLGYEDQNYFTRIFTAYYGESPRICRKKGGLKA